MIECKIDIKKESAQLKVSASASDLVMELFELFEQLDQHCPSIFRASVFAYINTKADMLEDYKRVSDSTLTKLLMQIIKESKNDDNN